MTIAGSLRHGKNQVCCPARKIISLSVVTLLSSDCGGYIMMFNENKQVGPIGATASALSGKIPANQPPDQTSLTHLPSCCKTPGFRLPGVFVKRALTQPVRISRQRRSAPA